MQTKGVITASTWRALVEFRVKKKLGSSKAQTISDDSLQRILSIIVLFPGCFLLSSYFVFHMALSTAATVAVLWFVSFFLAGLLYHRSVVNIATKRPSVPHLDEPREYIIEAGWLVSRTPDTENRISLKRAIDLIVRPTVSFLDCGDLGPVLLPFGSESNPDQRDFLDGLRNQLSKPAVI